MSQMLALVILTFILFVGDFATIKSKAWIPSIFVCAVLILLGYWTFFPKEIIAEAGIPSVVATVLMYLLVINMGTLLSLDELKRQWKTIIIALSGILGAIILLLSIGTLLFGLKTVIVAIPPLVGGLVSSLIMSDGATEAGLTSLSVFAVVVYVLQGFAGYPLTSVMLKKEGKRLLRLNRNGQLAKKEIAASTENQNEGINILAKVPEKYNTNFFILFKMAVVAYLAYIVSTGLESIVSISPYVLCLIFGVLATHVGFLEKQSLEKANGFGFAMMGLILYILDGLKNATPDMMTDIIFILVGTIALGVAGMYIFSLLAGKVFKYSKEMSFAVALTALYGFPADYIITTEVIGSLTNDKEEKEVLTNHMLPPMLVGGFVTVTVVSVILAGTLVNFL